MYDGVSGKPAGTAVAVKEMYLKAGDVLLFTDAINTRLRGNVPIPAIVGQLSIATRQNMCVNDSTIRTSDALQRRFDTRQTHHLLNPWHRDDRQLYSGANPMAETEPMRYGISAAALVTQQQRLLLVNHRKRGQYDFWVPPGGKLQGSESIFDCARRETMEETGLSVVLDRIIYIVEYAEPGYHFCKFFIRCKRFDGEAHPCQ